MMPNPPGSGPMNDDYPAADPREDHTLGASTIFRLCAEVIALREMNNRQHKLFDQTLAKTRDTLQDGFNKFAAETHKAYQNLRQETQGEKRFSLALLNELL